MFRFFALKNLILLAISVPCLVLGGTVGASTYQEYETWQDKRWGVLEHIFAITSNGLDPVPSWRCIDPPDPIAPSPVRVVTFSTLGQAPDTGSWPEDVAGRLGVPLAFQPLVADAGLESARAHAVAHPDEIVLVYTDQYFRGPRLNDRLEGFACGNIAVINIEIDCPESIVAHEIGHVLGLRHTPTGLMRARGVECDARLLDEQSDWLKQRYKPIDDGFIPTLSAESTETASTGNGDREPDEHAQGL